MIKGISASWGYAIGYVFLKEEKTLIVEDRCNLNLNLEKERLAKAVELSRYQIEELRRKVEKEIGASEAEVFDSHLILLEDPEFIGAAELEIMNNCKSPEIAVKDIMNLYLNMMEQIEDEYLKERAADIKDVGNRVIGNLMGNIGDSFSDIKENTIVVAHDLTPSDTAQLDKSKVAAFITDIGGLTSHTAIMARALEIPAVVGLQDITGKVKNGDRIIVDGVAGIVIINPEVDVVEDYKAKQQHFEAGKNRLRKLIGRKIFSREGKEIEISANIGSLAEMEKVLEYGADGIGLFRTEFLYMDRSSMPGEEEQYEVYKKVLLKMGNKPVVIRTLDIGGDKNLPYLKTPPEMNPFLGYRAIRLCLDRKDIFKIQLRAILRASAFGNLKVMFPMITTPEEFIEARELMMKCMQELKDEGININENIETGMMVEVPSAAIRCDEFAEIVDFFSIGTNDLIQYTLAVDRTNEKISHLYNTMDPAVKKLIKITIEAAHKAGKWCGMCGEMAADERAIPELLNFGLDEFSMNPASILRTKQVILEQMEQPI